MANRYWVGGISSWNGTAGGKWSLTSGGSGGASVPTSADDVFFSNLSTGTCFISTGNTGAKSINCTGFAGTLAGTAAITVSGSVTLVAGMAYTYTGTLTINATSTITSAGKTFGNLTISALGSTVTLADALTVGAGSSTVLTAGTIDLAGFTLSTGVFNSDGYGGARAVAFGSGNIALTSTTASTLVLRLADAGNFSWTGTGGFTRNMAATATVQFGTGGTGTVSNAPNLTVNAGASLLTITTNSWWKNLNFTGSTCGVTGAAQNFSGSITLGGGAYTAFGGTFRASGTITCAGKTFGGVSFNNVINGAGITVDLADAYSGNTLTLTQGTFTTNNFNVTLAASFIASNTNTRALNMGSSTFTVGGPTFGVATSTGMTLSSGTSTVNMTSATAKNFNGGGLTYYNLNQGGAGALTISDSNTFNNITNSTQPATVTFTAGTTQTVSAFGLSGTAGNLITINSTTPGSQFTLSKASGTVNAQYLSIQDSNATGGAVWNSLISNGNVDAGNNTGWRFSLAGGNMFLMFN